MSILIRGMEMPKCCTECSCCRHDNWNGKTAHQCNVSFITFGAEDENWIYNTRPNWCPLVEIPTPHGRLGDLDKLNIHDISPVDGFCVMGVTEEDIELADTVIEGSET